MVTVGDVIEIFDLYTRPKKPKWHICICSERLLFLRVNTDPLWMPNYPLMTATNTFLEHESFVELRQLLHFGPHAVAIAMREAKNPLGRMSKTEARLLATAARRVPTLNQEQKDLIWVNLTDAGYR
jgi:hypothetical protein